jgi:uncharacterized protein (TIGR02611 family)
MFEQLKDAWHDFKQAPPGERFRRRYRERREGEPSGVRKPLTIAAGVLIVAAGLFFLPAPGPGFLIVLLGAALVAQESRLAARALDRTEVRLRALVAWGRGVWARASGPTTALLVLGVLALAAGAAYGAYRLLFAR